MGCEGIRNGTSANELQEGQDDHDPAQGEQDNARHRDEHGVTVYSPAKLSQATLHDRPGAHHRDSPFNPGLKRNLKVRDALKPMLGLERETSFTDV